jgi:predicted RNA-binding protein with PUA-like domain
MAYWLIKSEPNSWSWDDQVRVGTEPWTGVRNHQAAKYMKAMAVGDQVFFYHSVQQKSIVGVVEVARAAYPDPTDESHRFVCVDVKAVSSVQQPVPLKDIKSNPKLEHMPLLRQSRLSVCPVTDEEWEEILHMAHGLCPQSAPGRST